MTEYRVMLLKNIGACKPEHELNKNDWINISKHINLSEEFIREFHTEVDWYWVSRVQVLSENFIREFQGKVNWRFISRFQLISDDFLIEFKKKIAWHYIFLFGIPNYFIFKKFIIKSKFENIESINTSKLTDLQRREIQKILDVKYMFKLK